MTKDHPDMSMNAASPVTPTPEAVQQAFRLMTGHMVASAVNVVARLGISDRLAAGPESADDLARDCGVNADALYRVLRALASVGVFDEVSPRTFGLTPVGAALRDGPVRWMACGSRADSTSASTRMRCIRSRAASPR
jgi:hypothetical protein